MDREAVADWVGGYERAWRAEGTDSLRSLFADHASYRFSPYDDPIEGPPAIAETWEAEREGPDEPFSMTHEVIAVDGDTAVVRVDVTYTKSGTRQYRDLWVLRFQDGLCVSFEEWPFWPGKPRIAPSTT